MRSSITVLFIILLVTIITACSIQKGDPDMINTKPELSNPHNEITPPPAASSLITADEAKKRLDSGESIILLDVRTEEEYREKHIPASLLLPLSDLDDKAESEIPDKDATLFVYCRSGNRSATASKILVNLGYTKVYDLGGIIDWPYDTESAQ